MKTNETKYLTPEEKLEFESRRGLTKKVFLGDKIKVMLVDVMHDNGEITEVEKEVFIRGKFRGYFAACHTIPGDKNSPISFGYSLRQKKDKKIDKELGRTIAIRRALDNKGAIMKDFIPNSLKKEFGDFIIRCENYYQMTIL